MSYGEIIMCKYQAELKKVVDAYSLEMLNSNGQQIFSTMPLESQVKFISTHPSI